MKTILILLLASMVYSQAKEPVFIPMQVARPFKAIKNAPNVTVAKSTKFVQDDELVLGLEINGVSRAYPINMLTQPTREIINDTLGEKDIAATW